MDSVLLELEKARKDLLDLGLRNTLLNYRLLRSKGVDVVDELPQQVHRIIVREGRSMYFLPAPDSEEEDEQELLFEQPEAEEETGIAARHIDDKLQTPQTSQRLQRRLLNTYYTARTHIEEQGVNVLFLALGMLHWYESTSSDIERQAPLVLVPVELYRANVNTRFRLRYTGEELRGNLSLQAKLRMEFGADLPPVEDEEIDVQTYFSQVARAIKEQSGWSVDTSAVALGFFSFNKFLIFEDLNSDKWPEDAQPYQHEVLCALLGDGFHEPDPLVDDEDHLDDHVAPDDLVNVVDADGSQTLAILDAKRGRNLVIQGPPGTGKSQTISNIIAEAIGTQKKVLFVSEKMAALEVVKRRLDDIGLGDACLELHSHKTNKRSFLDELERVLGLGQPIVKGGVSQDVQILLETRNRLNSYCRSVNETIDQSGVTPYRAYGELAHLIQQLEGIDTPKVEGMNLDKWSADESRRRLGVTEKMQALCARIGIPQRHPFWGTRRKVYLPADRERVEALSEKALESLKDVRSSGAALAQELALHEPTNRIEVETLVRLARRLTEAPNLQGVDVKNKSWHTQSKELLALSKRGARLSVLHKDYDQELTRRAWEVDVVAVRASLAAYGAKWWRALAGDYRRARKVLTSLCEGQRPRPLIRQIELVDAIIEAQRLEQFLKRRDKLATSLFGTHWKNRTPDWDYLSRVTEWLNRLHRDVELGHVPAEALDVLASRQGWSEIEELFKRTETQLETHSAALEAVLTAVDLDEGRSGTGSLAAAAFQLQEDLLRDWARNASSLQDLVSFNHLADEMREIDLAPILGLATFWPHADGFLTQVLSQAWYSALLERALMERADLARFESATHEHDLSTFRALDAEMLHSNRALLALKHWESLPRHSAGGQLGVLRREFAKRKRHRPIRKLMQEAGNVIQTIKPVFMMSPLSIAAFIPPGTIEFDLVVFDEASQIRPVDAFGSILRGKQTVVVGDNRQLPPSSFFDKIGEVEDEDTESLLTDMSSILDAFCAQGAPQRMLRWHYRSRHESLIAVSNHEFYRGRLVVFPSPDANRGDVGLVFRHFPRTAYERGEGKRKNPEEAKLVAQAVMEHARARAELSLGVAAFGYAQMQEIQDQLEFLRREDPSCEEFFRAHTEEPFFVKNLENVQGDERDVILISVGYGRTKEGYLSMNFGPVNQDGGERRLNVLITRARRRCEVFTNLTGDDINLAKAKGLGIVALKRYLKYAETGVLDVPLPPSTSTESPFEEAVAHALRQFGYRVEPQVGSAGFFIDLAVVDSEKPGRYLLGIECDGATYHRARSARDRDRLRQEVLEDLGWTIHRVWSTDWFQNRDRTLRRIIQAIEAAKASQPVFPAKQRGGSVQRTHRTERNLPIPDSGSAVAYEAAKLAISPQERRLDNVPAAKMQDWVEKVVQVESPVHIDEVCRRIADAAGLKRIGKRVRQAVELGASGCAKSGNVRQRDDFLWLRRMEKPRVRDRSGLPNASRKLELVAPEELTAAIESVVRASMGINKDDLLQEVGRLFGFARVTKGMCKQLEDVLRSMIVEGQLLDQAGCLVLRSSS